ncbi:radical SAM protein [Acetivibrio clariflavus]|uniref:radical SAM/SPASM domain-containing protein n=1 Tax=Acetivibrio clariflavus TaxID=288965 RepID=UPI0031F5C47C
MISEKIILTPYLFKTRINGKEYIGNLLNNKYFIENSEKIEEIMNYFTELKNVPEKMNKDIKLIESLVKAKILASEKNLMLPLPNIELEITNYCNSSCVMCPRSKLSRKKGFMSEYIFGILTERLKELPVNEVEICGVGEPLLHKNVAEYVKKLKDIGINRVRINTNGSLLSDEKARALVESGLDSITISFHTIDPTKYFWMMKGLNYYNVLENIKNFIEKYKKNVEVTITCVVSKYNIDEIEGFKNFWKEISIDNIYFQNIQSRAGNLYSVENPAQKCKCPVFEQGLYISFEGKYLSCSNDFSGESSWGSIEESGLKECLNYKLNLIRKQELFEFCRYCDYDFQEQKYLKTNFHKHVTYPGV